MNKISALTTMMMVGFAVAACGGGDDPVTPDAAAAADAPAPDAPPALAGLGQKCNQNMPCPSSAMSCITTSAGAQSGFCSLECKPDASLMTDAQGMVASLNIMAADTAKCTAAYSAGPAGNPLCVLPVGGFTPMPPQGGFAPNTTYNFKAYCLVACTANNTCPSGMTCSNSRCLPN